MALEGDFLGSSHWSTLPIMPFFGRLLPHRQPAASSASAVIFKTTPIFIIHPGFEFSSEAAKKGPAAECCTFAKIKAFISDDKRLFSVFLVFAFGVLV